MCKEYPLYYHLVGVLKPYDWGEKKKESYIAHLLTQSQHTFPKNEKKTSSSIYPDLVDEAFYAELWFGVHQQGRAKLLPNHPKEHQNESLSTQILRHPNHMLGKKSSKRNLSFLFKILTSANPLSLQAHPNTKLAIELHARAPMLYPDMNHKPELVVSLENFSALIGFQSLTNLSKKWRNPDHTWWLKEFWEAPPSQSERYGDWLTRGLKSICRVKSKEIERIVQKKRKSLAGKKRSTSSPSIHTNEDKIFLQLVELFGMKDRGVLFPYLMNFCACKPGEALYIPPMTPHAYLKGRAIECQANSNNVIRLGLTKKNCDLDTFEMILADSDNQIGKKRTSPIKLHPRKKKLKYSPKQSFWTYSCSVSEFKLSRTELSQQETQNICCRTPCVVFCQHGEKTTDAIRFLSLKTRKILQEAQLHTGMFFFLPGDLIERGILLQTARKSHSKQTKPLTLHWCSMNAFLQ